MRCHAHSHQSPIIFFFTRYCHHNSHKHRARFPNWVLRNAWTQPPTTHPCHRRSGSFLIDYHSQNTTMVHGHVNIADFDDLPCDHTHTHTHTQHSRCALLACKSPTSRPTPTYMRERVQWWTWNSQRISDLILMHMLPCSIVNTFVLLRKGYRRSPNKKSVSVFTDVVVAHLFVAR